MVKLYLRYAQKQCFGVISSPGCNVTFDWTGRLALCGALEAVHVWNLRQLNLVLEQFSLSSYFLLDLVLLRQLILSGQQVRGDFRTEHQSVWYG
jgi:hypothetical protein